MKTFNIHAIIDIGDGAAAPRVTFPFPALLLPEPPHTVFHPGLLLGEEGEEVQFIPEPCPPQCPLHPGNVDLGPEKLQVLLQLQRKSRW